jgi:hypothetical protein
MCLGLLYIVSPGFCHSLSQSGIDLANDAPGHSHHQRLGWYAHPFRYHCSSSNDTAASDHDSVEQNAAHCNQAIILDGAAVKNDPVSNPNSLPDMTRNTFINVNDGAVLDIGLRSNDDWRHVSPQHSTIPDARVRAQRHLAHYSCGSRDKGGWVNRWGHTGGYCARAGGNSI